MTSKENKQLKSGQPVKNFIVNSENSRLYGVLGVSLLVTLIYPIQFMLIFPRLLTNLPNITGWLTWTFFFGYLLATVLALITLKHSLLEFLRRKNKITKDTQEWYETRINNFFVITMLITAITIGVGINFLNQEFTRFPITTNWWNVPENTLITNQEFIRNLECNSADQNYKRPVFERNINCKLVIDYKINLTNIRIVKSAPEFNFNSTNIKITSVHSSENKQIKHIFALEVPKTESVNYFIYLSFRENNSTKEKAYSIIKINEIVSPESHEDWINRKKGWFLILLSIPSLFIFRGMIDLKKLMGYE